MPIDGHGASSVLLFRRRAAPDGASSVTCRRQPVPPKMRFLFINLVVAFATKDGSWIRQNRNRLGEKIENHEQNPNRRRRQISLRRPSATSVRALVEHGCYSAHSSSTVVTAPLRRLPTKSGHPPSHPNFKHCPSSWCVTKEEALADGAPIVDATHFAALLASHQEDGPPSKVEFDDVDGEHHVITAAPKHLRLGTDGTAGALYGHELEAAAKQLGNEHGWMKGPRMVIDVHREGAKYDRGTVLALEKAAAPVASVIDDTATIRSQRVFGALPTPNSKWPFASHFDDFQGGVLRTVHVSSDSPPESNVVFRLSLVSWYNRPLQNPTVIGGVDVGGILAHATEKINAGETYFLSQKGGGDVRSPRGELQGRIARILVRVGSSHRHHLYTLPGAGRTLLYKDSCSWRARLRGGQAIARRPTCERRAARRPHDLLQ